jgi:hypothetical protein
MDFPTLLLIGAFVVIIITALALFSTVGPVSLDDTLNNDAPSNFESRLNKSRLQKGALAATAVGAGVAAAPMANAQDPRKKKDDGGSGCGDAALMTTGSDSGASDSGSDSDGGSSCGGGGCGD